MKKFEYIKKHLPSRPFRVNEDMDMLEELSKEGWELVSVLNEGVWFAYYFKREIVQAKPEAIKKLTIYQFANKMGFHYSPKTTRFFKINEPTDNRTFSEMKVSYEWYLNNGIFNLAFEGFQQNKLESHGEK